MKSKVIDVSLYEGFALILTSHLNVQAHAHSALQITFSVSGRKLRCTAQEAFIEDEIILVPPMKTHAFRENSDLILIVLIDDESAVAESFKLSAIQALDADDFSELRNYLHSLETQSIDLHKVQKILLRSRFFEAFKESTIDERIQKFILMLKEDENFLASALEAAELCHLSESRFLHLFKQETGLPYRKYLQWVKLKRALQHIKAGHSLTESAYIGGFSDSAHLSKYFKESFGLSPSEVF